jgi:succinyl-CoA synthetase alpha subunit
MQAYGTQVVAVIHVGHGGETFADIPVFDLVDEAIAAVGPIDASLIFTPSDQVADAALEAIAAGIRQLVITTPDVPPLDTLHIIRQAKATGTVILGAGSAGLIVPQHFLLGTMNTACYRPGQVGIIDRTRYLGDAIAWQLTQAGIGQSVAVHLGVGDILGSTFADWLPLLAQNEDTQAIVLLEQHRLGNDTATDYLDMALAKPIIAYIAGHSLPVNPWEQQTLPIAAQKVHALPHTCTAAAKIKDYEKYQIPWARSPQALTEWLQQTLKL